MNTDKIAYKHDEVAHKQDEVAHKQDEIASKLLNSAVCIDTNEETVTGIINVSDVLNIMKHKSSLIKFVNSCIDDRLAFECRKGNRETDIRFYYFDKGIAHAYYVKEH